jgi:DNA-binding Xre family transcriptional regulator
MNSYVCCRTDQRAFLRHIVFMITLQINELLGDRSHSWLAKITQTEYSVIRNLASQRSQRINYATLNKLCDALKCQPGDLLRKARKPR